MEFEGIPCPTATVFSPAGDGGHPPTEGVAVRGSEVAGVERPKHVPAFVPNPSFPILSSDAATLA